MRLHQIINEVYLGGQMLDTGPDDDKLEQRKQVIHAPLVLNTQVPLYHLLTSSYMSLYDFYRFILKCKN